MTKAGNHVPPQIRRVFNDIAASVPGVSVKEYPATTGKLGLRIGGSAVLFTYNSYRKGWLDTAARLGPKLKWFAFTPTHNKPDLYWAVELTPEAVEEAYRARRGEILADLTELIRT